MYDNDLFDLGDEEVIDTNEDFSPFELHGNALFDSFEERSEYCVDELNCELICTPLSQVNILSDDLTTSASSHEIVKLREVDESINEATSVDRDKCYLDGEKKNAYASYDYFEEKGSYYLIESIEFSF